MNDDERPPGGCRLDRETKTAQIELVDKRINYTDQILNIDVLVECFRQERKLLPVITSNEACDETRSQDQGVAH